MQNPRAACPALSIEMSEADVSMARLLPVVSLEAKATQTPSTVFEGVVQLKRQLLGFMWKTRRFVLDSNGLCSRFKGDGFREVSKSFQVTSSTVVVSEPGHDNTLFTVTFRAANYAQHIRAPSRGERDRWVEAFTEAIRKKTAAERRVDRKELAWHRIRSSCWLAIDGEVYDVSKFLDRHPGGADLLMQKAGRDASDAFHSAGARPSTVPNVFLSHSFSVRQATAAARLQEQSKTALWLELESSSPQPVQPQPQHHTPLQPRKPRPHPRSPTRLKDPGRKGSILHLSGHFGC